MTYIYYYINITNFQNLLSYFTLKLIKLKEKVENLRICTIHIINLYKLNNLSE